jgi:hypothetical protein
MNEFYTTQILTSVTVSIECISWLIKLTNNNDAQWKPEITLFQFAYELPYLKFISIQFQSKGETTVPYTLYLNRTTLIMKTA